MTVVISLWPAELVEHLSSVMSFMSVSAFSEMPNWSTNAFGKLVLCTESLIPI